MVVLCLGALGTALPVPPPADAFGMLPFIDHVEISPAGTHYAIIQWDQAVRLSKLKNRSQTA
jgi:hypothetical protein